MFDKETLSTFVTPADQQLAEQYRGQPAVVDALLDPADLQSAAEDRSETLELANGSQIRISSKQPAQSFQFGANDPAQAVVNTELEGMQHRADYLIEQMNLMLGEDGQPRPHLVHEYNRNALMLRQMQASAQFQKTYAVASLRARDARANGVAEMQQESEAQDRAANATAQRFDAIFGKTRIR